MARKKRLKYVEFVYVLDDLAEYTHIAEVLPVNKLFVNQDFQGREGEVASGSSKAEVIIIPDVLESDSTSEIIRRIKVP